MSVEQQVLVLTTQLAEANAQITLMATAFDTLRQESGTAVRELHRMLAEAKPVENKAKNINFVNAKIFEGGKYMGSAKESYKAWSKKVETYLNSQSARHAPSTGAERRIRCEGSNRRPEIGQLAVRRRGQTRSCTTSC